MMKIDELLPQTQDGLRQWARDLQDNEMVWDDSADTPERWAWFWFQLRKSEDRPEWFPSGKWATLQRIYEMLAREARKALGQQPAPEEISNEEMSVQSASPLMSESRSRSQAR